MSNKLRKAPAESMPEEHNLFRDYCFTSNPFPDTPGVILNGEDRRQNGEIYFSALTETEEKQFEKLLIPSPGNPDTKRIGFLMDYATRFGRGIGKTAFLNHQKKRIMTDYGALLTRDTHVIWAVYISPISNTDYNKSWKISRLIIKQLFEQGIITGAMCRIRAFSDLISNEVLKLIDDDMENRLGNNKWLEENGVNLLKLSAYEKRVLKEIGIDDKLTDIFINNLFLSPEKVENKLEGLGEAFWRREADDLLYSKLVKLFIKAGFTRGLILFDELEKVFIRLNAHERRVFTENIRYFFMDGDLENPRRGFYKVLFTIHPYLQELMNPHWDAAGLERYSALGGNNAHDYTIYLRPVDTRFAVPLADVYMKEFRTEDQDGKLSSNPLFPFTENSLKRALDLSQMVPGLYLSFLCRVIIKALNSNVRLIDEAFINRVSNELNPREPEKSDNPEPITPPLIDIKRV